MKFSVIELCAGLGGFRMGMEKEGYAVIGAVEKDRAVAEVYKENFGVDILGDVADVVDFGVSRVDVIVGGFPCQSFSRAGMQKGLEDKRGQLLFSLLPWVDRYMPKVVILENVPEMLKTGWEIVEKEMGKRGYVVSKEVLNAKDFGVPQSRRRVIIVCSRVGVLDFSGIHRRKEVTLQDILEKVEDGYIDEEKYVIIEKEDVSKQGVQFKGYFKGKKLRLDGSLNQSRIHSQPNRIYSVEGVFPTLMAGESSGRNWIWDGRGVRKLTETELKRLMGIPDEYVLLGSKAQRCRMLGNSICIGMVEAVAKIVRLQLLEKEREENGKVE